MSKTFAKASAFPLHWPPGFPVTKQRKGSQFKTSLFQALDNVQAELLRLAKDSGKKLENIIISSNYSLTETKPDNPGVAVWFEWDGEQTCIPVDRYTLVEDNLQAIYHCIAADRVKLRHGGLNLVKASYRGHMALAYQPERSWRQVLNYEGDTLAGVKAAYRKAISGAHPDRGGEGSQAAEINAAYKQALAELGEGVNHG